MPTIDGYAASSDSTTYEEVKLFSIHHSLANIANVNIENMPLRAHAQEWPPRDDSSLERIDKFGNDREI